MLSHSTYSADDAPSRARESPRVRLVPLDGAWLAFDRETGDRWLLRSEATRSLRQRAPLLALFSPSHACNLACSFCYRDASRTSVWTVDAAFSMLSKLADEGTLEVAFGGGEPFAYKGFASLAARLAAETPIVVHATTNGTLVTADNARALRGRVREFRVSAYDDTPWRRAVSILADNGFSTGVHWLVTKERLGSVKAMAREVLALGASKLFLLSYHGDDRSMHLDRDALAALAQEIESISDLPIEIGVSACWGDRLEPVPKLAPDRGADCGAGGLFVSIDPDGVLSPCSFHHQRRTGLDGAAVLDGWRALRHAGPARAPGCRRTQIQTTLRDGLFRWRAFAGNNSVDCLIVGRFGAAGAAEDAVRELRELVARPERALLEQAWAALEPARLRLGDVRREDPRVVNEIVNEQIEADDAWIREVAAWENPPSPVARYALSLGADDRAQRLPDAVEEADTLLSFGTLAIYDQGTTLQPFRDLSWLWALRGARAYEVRNGRQLLWAAEASSEDEARECAVELGGVHRESTVWGTVSINEWSSAPYGARGERRVVTVRNALVARGLRFEADLVRATSRASVADVEQAVASLRREAKSPTIHLRVDGLGARADELVEALDALARDPSTLSDWARQRIEGSRRWPRDLVTRRYGPALFVQASHMPFALGRGLVLRGASTPWSLEARSVRLTIGLIEDEPAPRAAARLRSFGLEPSARESDRSGTIVTDEPLAVLDRVARTVERRDVMFTATMTPARPVFAAAEHLQSRLGLRFARDAKR
jgi:MoaA/NifB/PqqE/SkfB family radical SAM enzyme